MFSEKIFFRNNVHVHEYATSLRRLFEGSCELHGNEFSRWGHELRHVIARCSGFSSLSITSCQHYFALLILYFYIDRGVLSSHSDCEEPQLSYSKLFVTHQRDQKHIIIGLKIYRKFCSCVLMFYFFI